MQRTLTAACTVEDTIKKSRFAAHAAPVVTVDAAMAFIAAHSVPEASHNCWAYRIGDAYRFYDDGEPGGTAGRPILQAIDGLHMDRVVVLVTRWFGGVKLGAGGLVRAYGGVAAQCLRAAMTAGQVADIIATARVQCSVDFHAQARLRARLAALDAVFLREDYRADGVTWLLELPCHQVAAAHAVHTDATRGQGRWEVQADVQSPEVQ